MTMPPCSLSITSEGQLAQTLPQLARLLGEEDVAAAQPLAHGADELHAPSAFGELIPATTPHVGPLPIQFLGHLSSSQLGRLLAAADVSLAPSVFPEAVGLVTVEALSAGALPLACYHSGLASVVDVVADALANPDLKSLAPGRCLTEELSRLTIEVLSRYPTSSSGFRNRLHDLCRRHFASWGTVAERYLELARSGDAG